MPPDIRRRLPMNSRLFVPLPLLKACFGIVGRVGRHARPAGRRIQEIRQQRKSGVGYHVGQATPSFQSWKLCLPLPLPSWLSCRPTNSVIPGGACFRPGIQELVRGAWVPKAVHDWGDENAPCLAAAIPPGFIPPKLSRGLVRRVGGSIPWRCRQFNFS